MLWGFGGGSLVVLEEGYHSWKRGWGILSRGFRQGHTEMPLEIDTSIMVWHKDNHLVLISTFRSIEVISQV